MSKALHLVAGLALSFASFASLSAFAYHLDDHERVVRQAYQEFAACVPGFQSRLNVGTLVGADLDEDLNLIGKWLHYSHFYSPHRDLRMWRADSSERIQDTQPGLQQCRSSRDAWTDEETADIGHIVHHLQDMTVPAHVVPVNHAAWDGFESYAFGGDISSEWNCGEIAAAVDEDLLNVLRETAEDTLRAVAALRVEAVAANGTATRELSGADFWFEPNGDGFGEYGSLGNAFGESNAGGYAIPDQAYRQFKQQQMKQAVRATLRALAWGFPQSRMRLAM